MGDPEPSTQLCGAVALICSSSAAVLITGLAERWFPYGHWFFAAASGMLVVTALIAVLEGVLVADRRWRRSERGKP